MGRKYLNGDFGTGTNSPQQIIKGEGEKIMNAIDKLIEKIKETNNPTVIGLDPRYEMLPKCVTSKYSRRFRRSSKGYYRI